MLDRKIAEYSAKAKQYDQKRSKIKKSAEEYQKTYDRLNIHDDQFDMAEACLSLSIAILGITALSRQKRWLFGIGFVLAAFGVALGVSGFSATTCIPISWRGFSARAAFLRGIVQDRRVKIYDTSLRDGTQAEDVSFSVEDKLRIAHALDELGVSYIEGGWPGFQPARRGVFRSGTRETLTKPIRRLRLDPPLRRSADKDPI